MKQLVELKRTRELKAKRFLELATKNASRKDGEEPDTSDVSEMAALRAALADLDSRITDLEAAISAAADAAQAVGGDSNQAGDDMGAGDGEKSWKGFGTMGSDGRITPHGYGEAQSKAAESADRLKGKGFKMARFLLGVSQIKSEGRAGAAEFIERRFGDKQVAKALNTTGVATGGALIPQDFSSEFIELLRAQTIFRESGPRMMTMPLGNMTIPRFAAGAIAGFQGELDDIPTSQETFDDVQLNAKKLTAAVPVSNDLIRRAPIGVEGLIRDDLVQTVARREDLANLLGDGSSGSVIGVYNQCAATAKFTVLPFAATDNATIFNAVSSVLVGMITQLKNSMSLMIRPVWLMSVGTESFLKGLINQFGMYPYKDEMEAGKLWGYPYKASQQLPTNVNTGTIAAPINNGSYLMLVDFNDVIMAETLDIRVDVSDVAGYKDSGGNMVSTFIRDQTVFRIIEEYDIALRHQASVAVSMLPGWYPAGFTTSSGAAYYVQALTGDMSAAPSTWGVAPPTGSNNPGNISAAVPGGTLPGRI